MSAEPTNLSEMLRCYMAMRQVSLRELAPRIGISHTTLFRVCEGRAMDAATLLKVVNWMVAR